MKRRSRLEFRGAIAFFSSEDVLSNLLEHPDYCRGGFSDQLDGNTDNLTSKPALIHRGREVGFLQESRLLRDIFSVIGFVKKAYR